MDLIVADSKEEIITSVEQDGVMYREEWNRRRSCLTPCSSCGLIHFNYMLTTWIYFVNKFDYEVLIPDLDALKMDGDTIIILPEHVIKILDKLVELRKLREQKRATVDEDESMATDS
ncbi:hypothetical protein ACP70R_047242 [Stipagrostis hirtigluma subsp. patula]